MIIIDTERFDCVLELTLQTTMSGLLVIHIGRLQTYFINVIYRARLQIARELNLRIGAFAISILRQFLLLLASSLRAFETEYLVSTSVTVVWTRGLYSGREAIQRMCP